MNAQQAFEERLKGVHIVGVDFGGEEPEPGQLGQNVRGLRLANGLVLTLEADCECEAGTSNPTPVWAWTVGSDGRYVGPALDDGDDD